MNTITNKLAHLLSFALLAGLVPVMSLQAEAGQPRHPAAGNALGGLPGQVGRQRAVALADATREAVKADIGITNGGGIRGNKEYPAGATLSRRTFAIYVQRPDRLGAVHADDDDPRDLETIAALFPMFAHPALAARYERQDQRVVATGRPLLDALEAMLAPPTTRSAMMRSAPTVGRKVVSVRIMEPVMS